MFDLKNSQNKNLPPRRKELKEKIEVFRQVYLLREFLCQLKCDLFIVFKIVIHKNSKNNWSKIFETLRPSRLCVKKMI